MSNHHPYAAAMQVTNAMPAKPHSRKGSAQWLMSGLAAGILGLATMPAHAITIYDITLMGLYDAGHTRSSDGYQYNTVEALNGAGWAAGVTERYNGATSNGQSVWLYNGSNTQKIGLTGAEHTRSSDGYQNNRITLSSNALNAAGQVVGVAERYNGATSNGQSVWLYNGSNTQEIGLTGAGYAGSGGYQYNAAAALNAAGQVAGNFSGGYGSSSAWFYNGSSTQEIGLTGAGYIRNSTIRMNEAGQVAGYATLDGYTTPGGQVAWLYNGSTSQMIGPADAEHTSSVGYRMSDIHSLNSAGQVAGTANRYNGADINGNSAWFYNGSSTQKIGLSDAEHTRSADGYQVNFVHHLNAGGQVVGGAFRYNGTTDNIIHVGTTDNGYSAWLYNGSSTQKIGLTGAEHTRSSDGYQYNFANNLNAAGQVAGWTNRYNGTISNGQSVWLYNGSTTQQIGLTDAEHTRSDGYQYNSIQYGNALNAAGLVVGDAMRFNGSVSTGQSAWLYDSLTSLTYSMDASVSTLTGEAFSSISYLGDDGLTLGFYTLFDAGGTSLGNRAFSFTVADGWSDLGSLVDGGLNDAGWNYLATTVRANGTGYIVGNGVLTSMNGQAAYLLTPVPEPEIWAMLLAGLGLVGAMARRRKLAKV